MISLGFSWSTLNDTDAGVRCFCSLTMMAVEMGIERCSRCDAWISFTRLISIHAAEWVMSGLEPRLPEGVVAKVKRYVSHRLSNHPWTDICTVDDVRGRGCVMTITEQQASVPGSRTKEISNHDLAQSFVLLFPSILRWKAEQRFSTSSDSSSFEYSLARHLIDSCPSKNHGAVYRIIISRRLFLYL
jgi:hypothetical protein